MEIKKRGKNICPLNCVGLDGTDWHEPICKKGCGSAHVIYRVHCSAHRPSKTLSHLSREINFCKPASLNSLLKEFNGTEKHGFYTRYISLHLQILTCKHLLLNKTFAFTIYTLHNSSYLQTVCYIIYIHYITYFSTIRYFTLLTAILCIAYLQASLSVGYKLWIHDAIAEWFHRLL